MSLVDWENWTPIAREYHPLLCGSIDGTDDYPHDKGIIRALNSRYKPNKQVVGDPLCTIFVGRLNPDTDETTLEQIFSEYGSIKRLRLVRDIISGYSKRYAFIEYKSGSSARRAAYKADKMQVDDRTILVDMECERELKGWIPRRLGGGFGGKKESGQLRFGGKDRPFKRPIILDKMMRAKNIDKYPTESSRKHDTSDRNKSQSFHSSYNSSYTSKSSYQHSDSDDRHSWKRSQSTSHHYDDRRPRSRERLSRRSRSPHYHSHSKRSRRSRSRSHPKQKKSKKKKSHSSKDHSPDSRDSSTHKKSKHKSRSRKDSTRSRSNSKD